MVPQRKISNTYENPLAVCHSHQTLNNAAMEGTGLYSPHIILLFSLPTRTIWRVFADNTLHCPVNGVLPFGEENQLSVSFSLCRQDRSGPVKKPSRGPCCSFHSMQLPVRLQLYRPRFPHSVPSSFHWSLLSCMYTTVHNVSKILGDLF